MQRLTILAIVTALTACAGPPSAKRARTLLDEGDFAGAEREANLGLQQHPDNRELWKLKIRTYLGRGDNRSAVDAYAGWRKQRGGEHDADMLGLMSRSVLYQLLRVPAPDVRVAAIQAVERLEIEALASDVADRLGDDNDWVRAAAAVALLRSHPQAPGLAQKLLASPEPRARAMVIRGIARKLEGKARTAVIGALRDRDPAVRRVAVTALGGIAVSTDAGILAELIGDKDEQIRARALRALVRSKLTVDSQQVARVIDDRYLGARLAAIEYIEAQDGEYLDGFLVAATASDDLAVALRASAALHKRGKGGGTELVTRALSDPAWPIRASAMNQLQNLVSDADALRLAGMGLADRRIEVRLAAARTLLRLGNEKPALTVLQPALAAPTDEARLIAAIALARRGHREAHRVLAKLTSSRTPMMRSRALAAHRTLRLVTDGLIIALADDSAAIRIQAAEVLLAIGD